MRFEAIRFYTYETSFKHPIKTPKIHLNSRKVLVIELISETKASFFGESNAFETDWYDTETIKTVYRTLNQWFEEIVKGKNVNDFDDAKVLLNHLSHAPAARSTATMALFQVFHSLPTFEVDYGATVSGLKQDNYQQLLDTKPQRIKLKWSENVLEDLNQLKALPFKPQLALDANESLTKSEINTLSAIQNTTDILYIEEPFLNLGILKENIQNPIPPIAIDEKARDLKTILEIVQNYPIDTVILKPFRLGGIDKVLEAMTMLKHQHIKVVIGGMYEYGLSRYFTAYLSRYADYPGDLTPYGYYFNQEFVKENGILKEGTIQFVPPEVKKDVLKPYE